MGPREQENRLSLFSFLNMKMRGIPDNNKPNINAIYIFTMSLRALKGRVNPSLRAKRGNLNLFLRDRHVALLLAMTLE